MQPDDDRPKEGHDEDVDEQTPSQKTPVELPPGKDSAESEAESAEEVKPETTAEEGDDVEIPSLTPSVRQFVMASRDNECELCSAAGAAEGVELEIHHRKEQAEGGTNHPENLILLCRDCHSVHHGNEPAEPLTTQASAATDAEETDSEADGEPLPPHSEPNETDGQILSLIEEHGPVRTGDIAAEIDCSKQYVRRQCWKLSGEQLIARLEAGGWELKEEADTDEIDIGLPDDPKKAKRAGRDEIIRCMSAHGMAHTEIAEITNISRSTVDIAVSRARALRINEDSQDDPSEVNMATIATRLSALLDTIDYAQTDR